MLEGWNVCSCTIIRSLPWCWLFGLLPQDEKREKSVFELHISFSIDLHSKVTLY